MRLSLVLIRAIAILSSSRRKDFGTNCFAGERIRELVQSFNCPLYSAVGVRTFKCKGERIADGGSALPSLFIRARDFDFP